MTRKPITSKEVGEIADALLPQIHALLRGNQPEVLGWIAAELSARFISGFTGERQREEMLDLHIATVQELIPIIAAEVHATPDISHSH